MQVKNVPLIASNFHIFQPLSYSMAFTPGIGLASQSLLHSFGSAPPRRRSASAWGRARAGPAPRGGTVRRHSQSRCSLAARSNAFLKPFGGIQTKRYRTERYNYTDLFLPIRVLNCVENKQKLSPVSRFIVIAFL